MSPGELTPELKVLIDAEIADAGGGGGGGSQTVQVADVTLEPADILTVHSVPVEIIPTPGPDKLIVPLCVALYYEPGTVQFVSAGQALAFLYDVTDGTQTGEDPGPPIFADDNLDHILSSATELVSVLYASPVNLYLDPVNCVDKPVLAYAAVTDPFSGPIISSALGSSGGAGYAPGDTGVIALGNFDATYTVNTVGGGGAVLTYTLDNPGTSYSVANDAGTIPSTGGGDGLFAIDITEVDGVMGDSTIRVVCVHYVIDLS